MTEELRNQMNEGLERRENVRPGRRGHLQLIKENKMAKTIEVSDEIYEKIKEQLGQDVFKDIADLKDMIEETSL